MSITVDPKSKDIVELRGDFAIIDDVLVGIPFDCGLSVEKSEFGYIISINKFE